MASSGSIPGGKKTGGRVAGTPNKVTFDLIQMLREKGFEPAAALVEIHAISMENYSRAEHNRKLAEEEYNKWSDEEGKPRKKVPLNEEGTTALKEARAAAAELMQYTHPKRKAIEHTGAGGAPLEIKPVVFYLPDNGRSKRD